MTSAKTALYKSAPNPSAGTVLQLACTIAGSATRNNGTAPPAIVNAVCDALAPFGVRHIDMPLKPEKVWRAMQAATATAVQPAKPPRRNA
jgi:hypothetical protein